MECKHEFIGISSGVRCKLCGKSLTAEQYRDYITPKLKEEKPQPRRKRGKEVQGHD